MYSVPFTNILTMTKPEISSMKVASIFINLYSLGFNITCSFEKNGIDQFKKLKHDSLKLIIPSYSNIFFIPVNVLNVLCIGLNDDSTLVLVA